MTEHPPPGAAPARSGRARSGLVSALREAAVVLIAALVLSLVVKTFLGQAFYIPSISMQPALEVGDRVLVSKLTPGPFDLERGDVVVFKDPGGWLDPVLEPERGPVASTAVSILTFVGILPQDSGEHLVKRVIGLPGDTVACCDAQGRVTVNGLPVDEGSYVYPGDAPSDVDFSIEVPEGRLWVMGDHRGSSEDSRYHLDLEGEGTVPVEDVVGRAVVTVWPLTRLGWLPAHEESFSAVPPDPSAAPSTTDTARAPASP
jgi:signal peptidase I